MHAQANVRLLRAKWTQEKLLAEARLRTKELFNPKEVQTMLADLIKEAGWSEQEFIDVLCQDIIRRGMH